MSKFFYCKNTTRTGADKSNVVTDIKNFFIRNIPPFSFFPDRACFCSVACKKNIIRFCKDYGFFVYDRIRRFFAFKNIFSTGIFYNVVYKSIFSGTHKRRIPDFPINRRSLFFCFCFFLNDIAVDRFNF